MYCAKAYVATELGGLPMLAVQENAARAVEALAPWIEEVPLKDRRSVFPGRIGQQGAEGDTQDLRGVARKLARGEISRVVVMCGAGMSVSAGIPDFRSEDGLYALIGKQRPNMNAKPRSVFSMGGFKKDPATTNAILRAMVPDGTFKPTPAHYFLAAELNSSKKLPDRVSTHRLS